MSKSNLSPSELDAVSVATARPRGQRFGLVLAIVAVILLGGIGWIYWFLNRAENGRELLAEQLRIIASRSQPLTTVELDKYYVAVAGRKDVTESCLVALADIEKSISLDLEKSLPYFGESSKFIPVPPEPWTEKSEVESYLKRFEKPLEFFHGLADQEVTARFPVDLSQGTAALLPHIQTLSKVSVLMSLEVHVALQNEDKSRSIELFLAEVSLASLLDEEPLLLSQLAKASMLERAFNDLSDLFKATPLDESELKRIRECVQKINVERGLTRALIGERALEYSTCLGPDRMSQGEKIDASTSESIAKSGVRNPSSVARLMQQFSRLISLSQEGLFQAQEESAQISKELSEIGKNPATLQTYAMTIAVDGSLGKILAKFAVVQALRDCSDLVIAAELFRRESVDRAVRAYQLEPKYLKKMLTDPFSGRYLMLSPSRVFTTAYSVGEDRIDQGGTMVQRYQPDIIMAIPTRHELR
jgi:hypothetical protein